jgi:hypothetical protein
MFFGSLILFLKITLQPADPLVACTVATSDTTTPVQQRTIIDILTIKKENDSTVSSQQSFIDACHKWELTKSTISKLLQRSKPIDGHRWHYAYDVAPCNYTGQLRYNGRPGTYRLNAGAFCIITLQDSSLRLGYEHADALKYFLSKPALP